MGLIGAGLKTFGKLGTRVATKSGAKTAAAAGAGAGGGLLLDDVPIVGDNLDPTEGNNQGGLFGGDIKMLIVLVIVLVVVMEVSGD